MPNLFHSPFSNLALFSILINLVLPFPVLVGQDWARKMFKEFSHDFGTLAKNEFAEHRFEIENIYQEDMRIQSVTTSCACTEVSLEKKELKSREKTELVAVFNTRNFVGPKQATISIRFAQPYTGEVQLTVRGNVRSDVMFEPGAIEFGSITQDAIRQKSAGRQIAITKFNSPNWKIVDVKSTFTDIGVSLSEQNRIGNQTKYTMDVRIKESSPVGFVQGELILVAEESGTISNLPIKFSAKVLSDLQVSPEIITMAAAASGSVIEKKVIVKAPSPFKIKDVTCTSSCFSVSADPESSKKVHFVTVAYEPETNPGSYEYDLEIVTDLGGETKTSIKAVVEISPMNEPAANQ